MAMVPVAEWSWPTVTVSSVTARPVVLTSEVGGFACAVAAAKARQATPRMLCFISLVFMMFESISGGHSEEGLCILPDDGELHGPCHDGERGLEIDSPWVG